MSEINYVVERVPLKTIYADDAFNCRGEISALSVSELAQSIMDKGLQFPIVVQPAKDVPGGLPASFDFRIVAGHRRHMAFSVLNRSDPSADRWQAIPAMIRPGLDEIQARVLNFSENLDREQLNILQEARALRGLKEAGVGRDHVAGMIKKSSGWVQTRFNLLSLPDEIQLEAAAGFITQLQIKQLYSLGSPDEQFAMVRKIKEAKMRGEKVEHAGRKKRMTATVKKERKGSEIFDMMEILAKALGYSLTTRFGAWATGSISSAEFFEDIRKEATAQGKTFYPPQEF